MESILETIKMTLESGEDGLISGFGKFCAKEKKERRARNPSQLMAYEQLSLFILCKNLTGHY
jgi:nucleoid DNA-binding protein